MVQSYWVRIALLGAAASLLILTAVAILVQSQPSLAAHLDYWGLLSVDTAFALLVYGIALIACVFGHNGLARVATGVVVLLMAANLADGFLPFPVTLTSLLSAGIGLSPGFMYPMASNTAISLLIAAALLPLLAGGHGPLRLSLLGVGSTLVLVTALVPLFGFLTSLEAGIHWPYVADMAALTSLALVVIGATALFIAIYASRTFFTSRPLSWPSAAIAIGAVLSSGYLYIALENAQEEYLQRSMDTDARAAAREIQAGLRSEIRSLTGMARWVGQGTTGIDPRTAAILQEQAFRDGYLGLVWLDAELVPRLRLSRRGNDSQLNPALINGAISRSELQQVIDRRSYTISEPVRLHGAPTAFYIYLPVFTNGALNGVLVAAYDAGGVFRPMLNAFVTNGVSVEVFSGNNLLYRAGLPDAESRHRSMMVMNQAAAPAWAVRVRPSRAMIDRYQTILPETVFLLGSGLGLMTATSTRTRQKLAATHQKVRELNEGLERTVEARTRELVREVARREKAGAALAHAAKHDALTGLPNRDLFMEHLVHALMRAKREDGLVGVMFVDLDNFKDVNDSYGHAAGDGLLRQIAARLCRSVRQSDVVARQSGDEFLVLADTLRHPEEVAEIAEKVIQSVSWGFELQEHEISVSVSIGLAVYPEGGTDAATLIRNADGAMYHAKTNGRNRFEFHSPELQARALRRLEIKAALAHALEQQELAVYYQPRLSLATRRMASAEALVRWYRPDTGEFLSPDTFIPVAEETGMVTALGTWVLGQVSRDMRGWAERGVALPLISVNTSVHQFRDARLLRDLECMPPHPDIRRHLELELTERALIDNRPEYRSLLRQVSEQGIRIAIDDFGTGCASFDYFRNFPINTVKIDQSFIRHLADNAHDAMITRSIIDFARNFSLNVVAEGVETEQQCRRLADWGCDEAQGFLFARPMPASTFLDYWKRELLLPS